MVTIYPTGNAGGGGGYTYNVNTNTTSNTPIVNSGYPIQASVSWITGTSSTGGKSVAATEVEQILQALFLLKPKLKKKYKGDTAKLRAELLAAARHKEDQGAFYKVTDLLGIED